MNIKKLLALTLVAGAVAAPVKEAEARHHHHGGFRHCHGGWGHGRHHFWGGFAGGVVGGLVSGWARPWSYTAPVVVSTPYYTPVVTYPQTTVVSQPAPVIQQAPQQTVVREVIKEAPAPKPTYPKLNPGESMTVKPDGTIIITRQGNVPAQVLSNQNER